MPQTIVSLISFIIVGGATVVFAILATLSMLTQILSRARNPVCGLSLETMMVYKNVFDRVALISLITGAIYCLAPVLFTIYWLPIHSQTFRNIDIVIMVISLIMFTSFFFKILKRISPTTPHLVSPLMETVMVTFSTIARVVLVLLTIVAIVICTSTLSREMALNDHPNETLVNFEAENVSNVDLSDLTKANNKHGWVLL